MTQHTKGPWKAIAMGGSSTVVAPELPGRNDRRSEVGYGYLDGEYCVGYPFLDDDDRVRMDFVCFSHKDARLIAAAPDLLDCLRELYATVRGECPSILNEDSGGNAQLELAIIDAIAKATA